MKVSTYISGFLADRGVKDAFGIPGGVILDFLYALEDNECITPHLSYHEQCAAFSAGGYAQAGASLGVAYATRGPGIMNMVTSIADAYCDSLPVMIFTSHGSSLTGGKIRVMNNQEFDLGPLLLTITKYYARIDRLEDVVSAINEAYDKAVHGRKGPVVIDMASWLWNRELDLDEKETFGCGSERKETDVEIPVKRILQTIRESSRPVILAGEGIKQSDTVRELRSFSENNNIPVLTSRYAEDVIAESDLYYGYIGSHGIRSANFILSKADLIIALGNRLAFPVDSDSFRPLVEKTKIIRIDVDEEEFERKVPKSENYVCDLVDLMPVLARWKEGYRGAEEWIRVCDVLRTTLRDYDVNEPVRILSEILKKIPKDTVVTSDVGNHELWISRAYIQSGIGNRILYSKTFGALGCSLAKAIGAYYASLKPVVCFAGDQGLQMNIQELQAVAADRLPITIILINNRSSGMIRSGEKQRYQGRYVHTTRDSGYVAVNTPKIAEAYGIDYYLYDRLSESELENILTNGLRPAVVEVMVEEDTDVTPHLRRGDACQNLYPYIDRALFHRLDSL